VDEPQPESLSWQWLRWKLRGCRYDSYLFLDGINNDVERPHIPVHDGFVMGVAESSNELPEVVADLSRFQFWKNTAIIHALDQLKHERYPAALVG
jgi:hypothetical protein